ncbi:MAG: delta-60 repeat domain-containing protein [Chloroflexi bacterium]|nr:delta-60 repeat domain-containing protein [Chloroflexota bacterium]
MKRQQKQKHTGIILSLLTIIITLALVTAPVSASPTNNGSLDPTFGSNGTVTTDFGGYEEGHAVTLQTDGKLLVAGYAAGQDNDDFALVRYDSNGSLDTTFGNNGLVATDLGDYDYGYAMAIASDNKIIVAGYTGSDNVDFALVRYNADGSLDTSFDTDGKVTTDFGNDDYGRALAIQIDGKIIVAGYTGSNNIDFALVRYNVDGSLDTSFDTDGKVTTDFGGEDNALALALQDDGKLLVAGYAAGQTDDDFALVRYNSDGSLDTSFDTDGFAINNLGGNDDGYAVAIQPDEKILVAGSSGTDFALARYNSDGSLDTSFDSDGFAINNLGGNDYGFALTLQSDEKILVAGSSGSDFALVRYQTDGSLDSAFGSNDKVTTDLGGQDFGAALTLQADGKLIVAGYSSGNFALARYTLVGDLPSTATPSPTSTLVPTVVPTPLPSQISTTAQPEQASTLTVQEANSIDLIVQIPVGAVHEATTLVYQAAPSTNPPAALRFIGHAFTLTAYQNNLPLDHFVFDQPVTVRLSYTDAEISGLDEAQLQLLTLNVNTGQWSDDGITIIERRPLDNLLIVSIAHLTEFALTVPQHQIFLPLVSHR